MCVCVCLGQWNIVSTCVTGSSSTSSSLPPTHLGKDRFDPRPGSDPCADSDPSSVHRLNLRELGPLAAHMRWFVWFMAAAGTFYVFNYHEK